MKKFETLEDLAKATGQLAGYFTKNADFHKAAHAAHAGMHAHHEAAAAFHKAAHDAMDDGHEMKAHIGKVHEHHVAKAAHHKAMADLHKGYMEDSTKLAAAFGEEAPIQKAAPTPAPAPAVAGGIEGMMDTTISAMLAKALETIQTSGKIAEAVEQVVVAKVNEKLGNVVQPDGVRRAFGVSAPDGLTLVPRVGGPTEAEKGQVSPQMEDALAL